MRLFIGILLEEEVRKKIQEAWSIVPDFPSGCRLIDPKNWHFTLAFLDQVDDDNREPLIHLIEQAIENPPKGSFSFNAFETFPGKHPSYLIARAVAEERESWHSFINRLRDLVSVSAPNIDRKPWVPHVTVARAKKGKLLSKWSEPLQKDINFTPQEITLVKSTPTQNGSVYTDLHVFKFNR